MTRRIDLFAARIARRRCSVTSPWLVHACDWSHAETADAMGISPSTVSTHVTRALEALRLRLEALRLRLEVSADA